APRTPLLLLPRAGLAKESAEQQALGKAVQVLALDALPEGVAGVALPATPTDFAHGLYAALRELDTRGANLLLAERPPEGEAWLAIHDRLRRSAAGTGGTFGDDAP